MANNYIINTGDPRSVSGHLVSGALGAAILSGTINYDKATRGKISKSKALRNTFKQTAEGSIATGAAISAANHLGPQGGGWLQALTAISIGMTAIYAIEVIDKSLEQKAHETLENEQHIDTDDEAELPEEQLAQTK